MVLWSCDEEPVFSQTKILALDLRPQNYSQIMRKCSNERLRI